MPAEAKSKFAFTRRWALHVPRGFVVFRYASTQETIAGNAR